MSFVEKVGRMRGKRVGSQGSLTSGCQLPISEPPAAHPHNSGLSGALRPVFNVLIDSTCLFLHYVYAVG